MISRLVTVFGASGFLGRYVVSRLADADLRVRAATRHPNAALFLKPMGKVGQIQTVYANVADEKSVAAAVSGADAVINLVGILYQGWGAQKFRRIHDEGAANVARAANKAGAKTMIHVSAIGADAKSPSRYARTKAAGEQAVKRAFKGAAIVRPSIVFGAEDNFFNMFARMAMLPLAPLPLVGAKTKFQPVFVEDVAKAIAGLVQDPKQGKGKTFELGGPSVYTFRELMEYMLEVTGRDKMLLPIPFPLASVMGAVSAAVFRLLPFPPPLTLDQVRLLKRDNVVEKKKGVKTFKNLGITPTPLEVVVPAYLAPYRRRLSSG